MSLTKWKWACWSGEFRFSPASNHYNEALQSSIIISEMYYMPDYLAQSKVLVTLGSHPALHVHRKYPTLAWSQQVHSKCTNGHRPDNRAPHVTGTHSKFHHGVRSVTHTEAKKGGYPCSLRQPKRGIATQCHNLATRSDKHSSSWVLRTWERKYNNTFTLYVRRGNVTLVTVCRSQLYIHKNTPYLLHGAESFLRS